MEDFYLPPELSSANRRWLVTGVAGFIGSHLLENLLKAGQTVIGVDNFLTGKESTLEAVRGTVDSNTWSRFSFIDADICDQNAMQKACAGVDFVLHQAALGSVPRSVVDPLTSNTMNVGGFLSVLFAAKSAGVKRVVYASSSSVYGDNSDEVKTEARIGRCLSPYGASKRADEVYADSFAAVYGQSLVGLRYFNVFGPRQDPQGQYAAVIPRWIQAMALGQDCTIFGDGETSRDFCFVGNVVQANIRAALASKSFANEVFNVAVGETTSLTALHAAIAEALAEATKDATLAGRKAVYQEFRAGDIRHSLADISKAKSELGYRPSHTIQTGLRLTVPEFIGGAPAKI